ncbi:unnamed protein product [Diabrotica balteata]|uniref:Uncharacterized protein n=1 Tax=Diabrotica balteata TaxID=107213 RepID=A0A9N9SQ78_DIABA|nr:unnamed protein product [Diabrotica balteata]
MSIITLERFEYLIRTSNLDVCYAAMHELANNINSPGVFVTVDTATVLINILLNHLDANIDAISRLAIECLIGLSSKVTEDGMMSIIAYLHTIIYSYKPHLRTNAITTLLLILDKLPYYERQTHSYYNSDVIAQKVMKILASNECSLFHDMHLSVRLGVIKSTQVLLSRFGMILEYQHGPVLNSLLNELSCRDSSVSEACIDALTALVLHCNDNIYYDLILHLYSELMTRDNHMLAKTYIQCIASLCKQPEFILNYSLEAEERFATHVQRFIPAILKFSRLPDEDDLRIICFGTFKRFIYRFPKEVTPRIILIIELCLNYIRDEFPNHEGGDNNVVITNITWKVRKAALRCLDAMLKLPQPLMHLYVQVLPELISRFNDGNIIVRILVFNVFLKLLKSISSWGEENTNQVTEATLIISGRIEDIVNAAKFHVVQENSKIRLKCFSLLKELSILLPERFTDYFGDVLPAIVNSLGDSGGDCKVMFKALSCLLSILATYRNQLHYFHPYIRILLPPVTDSLNSRCHKTNGKALDVLQTLLIIVNPWILTILTLTLGHVLETYTIAPYGIYK